MHPSALHMETSCGCDDAPHIQTRLSVGAAIVNSLPHSHTLTHTYTSHLHRLVGEFGVRRVLDALAHLISMRV